MVWLISFLDKVHFDISFFFVGLIGPEILTKAIPEDGKT